MDSPRSRARGNINYSIAKTLLKKQANGFELVLTNRIKVFAKSVKI